ncbi:hypothetical protein B0H19DRAFT_1261099 [Mycena capillaripes]|nr:hypothetical protein B0H19DRAFT_1261099 [Mycena capillaripes]
MNRNRAGRRPYRDVVDYDQEEGGAEFMLSADRGVYFSRDGQRRQQELLNVSHKKRRLEPSELEDSLAQWILLPDDGFTEEGAREPLPSNSEETSLLGKRKEYNSTTNPMLGWCPLMGFFLDEVIRHEALGNDTNDPRCGHCHKAFTLSGEPPSRPPSNTLPTPQILPVALPVTGLPGPVPETGT